MAAYVWRLMGELGTRKPSYRSVVAALVESEERYRILVEGVRRYAIFMLNAKGTIITWNRGIEELLGYNRDEIVGQSGAVVFNQAERAAGVFREELARAKRFGESIEDHSNVRKDGSEVCVHDTVTSLHNAEGRLIGFAKVSRLRDPPSDSQTDTVAQELAKALATIQVEVEHRRLLEAQLLTAVEQERERLGRDLHDDLSQRLGGIAMITRSLVKKARGRSVADRDKMTAIGDMLADAIGVARNLSHGLHPVTLAAQGLPAALAELLERVPKDVQFNWPQSERLDLEQSVALHVYRIAEEAVGNAIRHSRCDKITIALRTISARKAILTITDNGKGFRLDGARQGMGLQNMRYRAGVIHGSIAVSTLPNRGTAVRCTFPTG